MAIRKVNYMVTPERFWEKLEESRGRTSWIKLSSFIDVSYNALMNHRSRGQYLPFDDTVKLCPALDIEFSWLMDVSQSCCEKEYEIIRNISKQDKKPEAIYWEVVDEYRRSLGLSWKVIAESIGTTGNAMSYAKTRKRPLPLDITVRLLLLLHIPVNAFAGLFYPDWSILESISDSSIETIAIRNEILQLIKRTEDRDRLWKIRAFADYVISRP